jgi:hypothetical protein
MVRPRLYFDTSVFGGIFDAEFREETEKLFASNYSAQFRYNACK